ncbi:MAG: hypothetical protein AAB706_03480 [Patescibacteria group bacterium]
MDYFFILYFLIGVLEDFLITLNWRYVAKEQALPAAFFSFLSTIVSMAIVYHILTLLDARRGALAITIYALGIAAGTFLAMKFNPNFKLIFQTKRRTKKAITPTSSTELKAANLLTEKKGEFYAS